MALIIKGKSKCSICHTVLDRDPITSWNAFLNKKHSLWKYSDSGMHVVCFNNWEHKEEFEHLYKYQPLVDFESPELKQQIQMYGIPDWLKKIKKYRKNNPRTKTI